MATTGDLRSLQSSLEKLRADPELCRKMGENAYKAFVKHHDVTSAVKVIEGIVRHA